MCGFLLGEEYWNASDGALDERLYANYPSREAPPPPVPLEDISDIPRSSSPDPFDTSRVFTTSRYYSDVAEAHNTYLNVDQCRQETEESTVWHLTDAPQSLSPVETQATVTSQSIQSESNRILDPKFLAELEKHLGQREASANTNPNSQENPDQINTNGKNNIPILKPPPQSTKLLNKSIQSKALNVPSCSPSGSWQQTPVQYRTTGCGEGSRPLRVQSVCLPATSSSVWSSAGVAQTSTSTSTLHQEINHSVKLLKNMWLSDKSPGESSLPSHQLLWPADSPLPVNHQSCLQGISPSTCAMNGMPRYAPF